VVEGQIIRYVGYVFIAVVVECLAHREFVMKVSHCVRACVKLTDKIATTCFPLSTAEHGSRKEARQGLLDFENFRKKGCFLSFEVTSGKKQISPLLAAPGKNSSDAHTADLTANRSCAPSSPLFVLPPWVN